jgi:membrane protein YdbS with pleckstrin-like domain
MKVLDYIFYRFAESYKKWDGEDAVTAIMAVSLVISMFIMDLLGFVYMIFFFDKYKNLYKKEGAFIVVLVMLIIIVFTYKRYRGQFKNIKKRWSNETKKQRVIRGFLVVSAFFISIILPFIIVKLK